MDGLFGPIVVNGQPDPNAAEYNQEWTWMASDWYNQSVAQLHTKYLSASNSNGYEPLPDAIIVNGVRDMQLRYTVNSTSKVRVRFINAAALSQFNVSVDGMSLRVIELDGQARGP